MKSLKFVRATQVAIVFLQNFKHSNATVLSQWKNFTWFQEIEVGEIIEKGTDMCDASKFTILERTVLFRGYEGMLLAELVVRGNKFTNTDKSHPTFWRVVKIKCMLNYNEMPPFQEAQWLEEEVMGELA